jgi:hypothetical protein
MTDQKKMWTEEEIEKIANESTRYHEKKSFMHDPFWGTLIIFGIAFVTTAFLLIGHQYSDFHTKPNLTPDQIGKMMGWEKTCVKWKKEVCYSKDNEAMKKHCYDTFFFEDKPYKFEEIQEWMLHYVHDFCKVGDYICVEVGYIPHCTQWTWFPPKEAST